MHFQYLFFALYIGCFLWLVPRVGFVRSTGLSFAESRILIILKVLGSVVCAYYFEKIFVKVDYMEINREGFVQYNLLRSDPRLFFTDFTTDLKQYGVGRIFDTENSFWGNLRFVLVYKFLAFLNLVTNGNFYLNSILFSSIVFWGHIAFYRIYNDLYPGKKIVKIIVCFFLPSIVLYTACVHKDGFVFLSLGLSSFLFYGFLNNRQSFHIKKTIAFLCCLLCIFLFRNYVLVALIPAMAVAVVVSKVSKHKILLAFGLYVIGAVLFFVTGMFNNSLNLPVAVVKRKAAFALLEKGSTNLEMNELQPDFLSFAKNTPQAINHSLLRPYPNQIANKGTLAASLELYFYLALMLIFLIRNKRYTTSFIHPFNIYGLAFFITMMLIIGYTIPNVGAIVRYRSLMWIFILCPMVCCIDWGRLAFWRAKCA